MKTFTSHTKAAVLAKEFEMERHMFRAIVFVMLALSLLYGYLVVSSALAVIAQNSMSDQTVQLESSLGTLEAEYLALSREVTPEQGAVLGLAPVSDTTYVRRPSETAFAGGAADAI